MSEVEQEQGTEATPDPTAPTDPTAPDTDAPDTDTEQDGDED